MDGVSAASAIVALAGFAEAVSKSVFTYAKSVKTCQKEITQLSIEITTLFGILRGAQLLLYGLDSSAILEEQVDECWKLLQLIETRLDRSRSVPASNSRVRNIVKNLAWPFTLSYTKELLGKIERQKTAFNLAISSEGLSAVVRSQNDLACEVRNLHQEIQQRHEIEVRIELNTHRKEILSFLGQFDSQGHFRISRKLRHEGTGMWFINGDKFCEWTASRNSHLWLFGIPGAGKTVLSSAIIENISSSNGNNDAIAYFYCDYKNQQTQEPYTIFASLAKQLAVQSKEAFDLVAQCYNTFHGNGRVSGKVDVDQLVDLVSSMAGCFNSTSIVLDGLDECGDNVATVLEFWVSFLQQSADSLRTIVLSRDEWMIRKILRHQNYDMMSIAAESTDIRRYAMAEIEKRCQRGDLDIDDPSFKLFIMEKLVEKAEGMFRWVACQFDFLKDLASEDAYREALDSLPPSLPATYERMLEKLLKLPCSTLRIIQEALKWILFSTAPLDMASLCEASSIEAGSEKHKVRGIIKPAAIERHCGSFIRKSADGNYFESAHFSVKEFFQSLDPEAIPCSVGFCMDEQSIRVDQTITCLTYLTYEDFRRPVPRDLHEITKYAFYHHAATKFPDYSKKCWDHESVQRLGRKLFNPEKSSNLLLWCHYYLFNRNENSGPWELSFDEFHGLLSSDRNLALRWAAILGIPFLVGSIASRADEIDHNSCFGTPLLAVILGTECIRLKPQLKPQPRYMKELEPLGPYIFTMISVSPEWNEARQACAEQLLSCSVDCGIPGTTYFGRDVSILELLLHSAADVGVVQKVAKLSKPLDNAWLKRQRETHSFLSSKEHFATYDRDNFFHHLFEMIDAAKVNITCGNDYVEFANYARASAKLELPADVHSTLRAAARQGSVDIIEDIVTIRGIDIDSIGPMGRTALHFAARSGSAQCMDLLVRKGASLRKRDSLGYSALHYAAQSRQLDCVIMLMDLQLYVEEKTLAGETLAHIAARADNKELLKHLLERFGKASLHVHDRDVCGQTPVLTAIKFGSGDSLRFLLPFSDPNDKVLDDEPLLHVVANHFNIEYLHLLIRSGADQMARCDDGSNLLHHLAVNPRATTQSLTAFINAGVSINDVDKHGNTPLHRLLSDGNVDDSDKCGVLLLLTSKENINLANAVGNSPLYLLLNATMDIYRKVQCLTAFLKLGANVCLRAGTRDSFFQEVIRRLAKSIYTKPTKIRKELLAETVDIYRLLSVTLGAITGPQHLEQLVDNQRPLNVCLFDNKLSLELLSKGVDPGLRNTDQQGYCALEQLCTLEQEDIDERLVTTLFTSYKATSSLHSSGKTLLHILCGGPSINVRLLNQLCSLDPAVNTRDGRGNLCLISAMKNGKTAFVEQLLRFGARLDMIGGQDQCRWYPVHWAAYCNTVKILDLFSSQSIDWSQKVPEFEIQEVTIAECNALHLAIMYNRRVATAFLLEHKLINVNTPDGGGRTSIHLAAWCSNASMLTYLIGQGGDISARDNGGNSALHWALFNDEYNEEIVLMLTDRGAPNEPNENGQTPEVLALCKGRTNLIDILSSSQVTRKAQHAARIDRKTDRYRSHALSCAVKRGDLDLIKAIISKADLCIDQMMYDCGDCSLSLSSIYHGEDAVIRWLVESGCNLRGQLNCKHDHGFTAIHLAAKYAKLSPDLLTILLRTLDVEEWSTTSFSPLHVSVGKRNLEGTATILRFLANPSVFPGSEPTNAHPDIPNLKIAEVNKQLRDTPSNFRPELNLVRSEQEHGSTIPMSDFSGTPLHLAAFLGETEHLRLLLEHGAKVDITDAFMRTPLHFAAKAGEFETVKRLLEYGSNPNKKTVTGETALMLAAESGSENTFQTLVAYGADIGALDATGQTALSYCGSLKMISHATTIGCKPGESCHSWNSFDRVFDKTDGTAAYTLNSRLGDNVEPILLYTWLAMPTGSLMMLWSCSIANLCSRSEEGMVEQAQQYLIRAALRDDIQLIRRVCSALPRFSVEPLRHALVEAASWGRLQSVKELFRRLALYPDERTNAAILAFNAAKQFQDLQEWILVGCSMEQSSIGEGENINVYEPIKQWSGVRQLEISLEFRYAQVRRSLFEWAVWLHAEDKRQMIAYSRRRSKLKL